LTHAVVLVALAIVLSGGIARAAQEPVTVAPSSPIKGGKVLKSKTMTAVGTIKSVAADSLTLDDGTGKERTFVISTTTKVIAKAHPETVDVAPASPIEGGKVKPGTPRAGQETVDVAPASPVEGGKVIPGKKAGISDLKEGQRVQVTYHDVDGKMHATQVRVQ
jgi:hypothetical protein